MLPSVPCDFMHGSSMHQEFCTPTNLPSIKKAVPSIEQLDHMNYELLVPEAARSFLLKRYVRGDCNGDDGSLGSNDVLAIVNFVAGTSPVGCEDACDMNDDGIVDQADAIDLLNYLFSGGPPPTAPFPDCGLEPTFDLLNCEQETCP